MVSDAPFWRCKVRNSWLLRLLIRTKKTKRSTVGRIRAGSCQNMALILKYHVLLCRYLFLVDYHDTDLQESFHERYYATAWTDAHDADKLLYENYSRALNCNNERRPICSWFPLKKFLWKIFWKTVDCFWLNGFSVDVPEDENRIKMDQAGFYISSALIGTVRTQDKFVTEIKSI